MDEIQITEQPAVTTIGRSVCPKCGKIMKFCPHCGGTFCGNSDCADNDQYHLSECRADTGD